MIHIVQRRCIYNNNIIHIHDSIVRRRLEGSFSTRLWHIQRRGGLQPQDESSCPGTWFVCTCMSAYIHVCIYTRHHVRWTWPWKCAVYVRMHLHMYAYIYIIYIYIYIYITYIHTHTVSYARVESRRSQAYVHIYIEIHTNM